jgi:hypothetical protein
VRKPEEKHQLHDSSVVSVCCNPLDLLQLQRWKFNHFDLMNMEKGYVRGKKKEHHK